MQPLLLDPNPVLAPACGCRLIVRRPAGPWEIQYCSLHAKAHQLLIDARAVVKEAEKTVWPRTLAFEIACSKLDDLIQEIDLTFKEESHGTPDPDPADPGQLAHSDPAAG